MTSYQQRYRQGLVTGKDTGRDWLPGKIQSGTGYQERYRQGWLPGKIHSGTGYQERYSQGLVTRKDKVRDWLPE